MTGTFSSHFAFDLSWCVMRKYAEMQHVMISLLARCCLIVSLCKVYFLNERLHQLHYVVDLQFKELRKLQKRTFLFQVLEHNPNFNVQIHLRVVSRVLVIIWTLKCLLNYEDDSTSKICGVFSECKTGFIQMAKHEITFVVDLKS